MWRERSNAPTWRDDLRLLAMADAQPQVAVVMPALNAARTLPEAL
jgi:hypothetical protein